MPITSTPQTLRGQRGASAVFVALVLLILLGMAALAIDIGFGLNERRGDVTSADTGVMAGAVSVVFNDSEDVIVGEALAKVRSNLDTVYSDAEWQALWESCTDPGRLVFDPGTGTLVELQPLSEPLAWGGEDLDCISQGSSYLRVRVPDQLVDTHFARIWGTDTLSTSAAAVALIEPGLGRGGLIPFGISGSADSGELCLKTNPVGPAVPPCSGPSSGAFGEIDSELFGDFFGNPDCGLPGRDQLEQNIALGIDHFIASYPPGTITPGTAHPGDARVDALPGITHDACRISGGTLEAEFGVFPVNTMRVGVGFSPEPVENGLLSNKQYLGSESRLQQTCTAAACASAANPTRTIVKDDNGPSPEMWDVDNVGPWDFLTGAGTGDCSPSSYGGLTTDQKVSLFSNCLQGYAGTVDIFSDDINQSPRFAWAPQYYYLPSSTGTSWQPVLAYRMVFIGGLWFNCNASGDPPDCNDGVYFYPDEDVGAPVCDPQGAACSKLDLDQLSAWMFPDEAIPDSVRFAFPGGQSPFLAGLFR